MSAGLAGERSRPGWFPSCQVDPLPASAEGLRFVMVPEELVQRWEAAYRRYGEASKMSAVSFAGNEDVAREMVVASQEVANAWRAMESIPDLPWWVAAALSAGAQAFEFQAREWAVRAEGWMGPTRRLPTRSRPTPHRRTDEAGEQQ